MRIWDGLFLDGNEVLIRATIAVWKFFEAEILQTQTTDQFYQTMNAAMETMTTGSKIQEYDLVSGWFELIPKISKNFTIILAIYSMGPFPLPGLDALRAKYNREFQTPSEDSTLSSWIPRFSLRLPRSNSIHVPKEVRSSDDSTVRSTVNL